MIDRMGQQLGNYRLTRLIGRGGFADVYLGEHIYLRTAAAIKVLQTRLTNEDDMEGFLNEARTVAHLTHAHIVRVLDFGVHEEVPFLVMDYAPNGTLRQRHARGSQLPLATISTYVKQIADALQYAHEEKIIHRDIKPENMLLSKRNEVLLSDFGIAMMAQSSRYQQTENVAGTVAYMSPEQIQGKPRPASDQYALAIVTYEWLCGERPFHGSFTELCTQHMFAPLPPLKEKIPDINPSVEQVVTIALAKDPKQRFGSVRAYANALEQAAMNVATSSSQNETPAASTEQTKQQTPPVVLASTAATPAELPSQPEAVDHNKSATPSKPATSSNEHVPIPTPVSQPPMDVQEFVPREKPQQAQTPIRKAVTKRRSVWHIGKRELLAMLASLILFTLSGAVVGFTYPLPDNQLILTIDNVLFSSGWLFFAAAFGPWVGLFALLNYIAFDSTFALSFFPRIYAFDSSLVDPYDSSQSYLIGTLTTYWSAAIVVGIMGFLIGLIALRTRGRYTHLQSLALVSCASIIVQVLAFYISALLHFPSTTNGNVWLESALSSLVLLPIALFIYSLITSPGKRQ